MFEGVFLQFLEDLLDGSDNLICKDYFTKKRYLDFDPRLGVEITHRQYEILSVNFLYFYEKI